MDGGAGAVEVFLEFALGGGDGSGGELSRWMREEGKGAWVKGGLRFMSCHSSGADEQGAKLPGQEVLVGFEFPAHLLGGGLDEAEGECFETCGDGVVRGEDGAYG